MASSSRSEFNTPKGILGVSVHPAALFSKVSSLQDTLIEQLLVTHGGLEGMLEYIKTDTKLSDPKRYVLENALKNACTPTLVRKLLQAVIDDDHHTVRMLLDLNPKLLLVEPADIEVKEVESKKTWQRFLTERPLIMAQKLMRLEMIKTLLPYLEQLTNTSDLTTSETKEEKKPDVVKQWVLLPLVSEEEQKQQDEKLRQEYIKTYFKPLIETIAADNQVKVKWGLNTETKLYEAHIEGMSKTTASALESFREQLLPNAAIAIDSYVDIKQFLIAALEVHDTFYDDIIQNWHQREVFAICVIGFGQSLYDPKLGSVHCKALHGVVNDKKPISDRARSHKFMDGSYFYRLSRDAHSGLGFNFLYRILPGESDYHRQPSIFVCGTSLAMADTLKNYVKQERQSLANLRDECITRQSILPQFSNRGV
jgi:hypothetical protein